MASETTTPCPICGGAPEGDTCGGCGLPAPTAEVLAAVAAERRRQHAKWGEQNLPDGTGSPDDREIAAIARKECQRAAAAGRCTWRHVLDEEALEAFAESDPEKLRAELVQVAAVATQWIEAIDRRAKETARGADGFGSTGVR